MRYIMRLWWLTVVLGVCGLLVAGCGSSPPTKFYQLSSLSGSAEQKGEFIDQPRLMIGIGPLEIPPYVDRSQLVMRSNQNELELAEFDRWAEPLQTNITRVIVDNLTQSLPSDRVAVFSWDGLLSLDYQVRVEVTKFDLDKTGEVSLTARWTVVGEDGKKILAFHTSRFNRTAGTTDPAGMVSAMSQNLVAFSQEIATALQSRL